jgi:hypothetical protein
VVDHLVGAGGLGTLGAAGPGRGDHLGTGLLGQLHRVSADRTAGAVDQHPLTGGQLAMVEQRLPRGQAHQRERRRVGQRDVPGRPRQDLCGCDDVLRGRPRPRHRQETDDLVTDRDLVHVVAERVDRAGDVDSRRVRQLDRDGALHETGADVAVHAVEGRRGDADPDLTGTRGGLLDVLVTQNLGTAVLVKTHCLHR